MAIRHPSESINFKRLWLVALIALVGFWATPRRAGGFQEAWLELWPRAQTAPASFVVSRSAATTSSRMASVAVRRDHLPGPFPVEVLKVIDGDTIEARVRVWLGEEITTLVRLRGIDAPELKARCGRELQGAEAARDALAALLAQGAVSLEDVALDKFGGRVVASIFVDQPEGVAPLDVSDAMRKSGMARAYAGGARETWCPLPPVARG